MKPLIMEVQPTTARTRAEHIIETIRAGNFASQQDEDAITS